MVATWEAYIGQYVMDTGERFSVASGETVVLLEIQIPDSDDVLDAWACHFRNQYCLDSEIDYLRGGTGLTKAEYLVQVKFPDRSKAPGPSIRAGDFAEILLADYLAFVEDYWIPRTRYCNKTVRNESTKGCDTIAFRTLDVSNDSEDDELLVVEAKATLSGGPATARLQDAVVDSAKDYARLAESLNAIKQHLLRTEGKEQGNRIARFQNIVDRPYIRRYGAAAVLSGGAYDQTKLATTSTSSHPSTGQLMLWVVRGTDLMDLVHHLYDRACHGA